MTKILCDVYKTRKKDEMYLYVSRTDGLERVPDALKEQFGKPELALTMMLSADKRLGRAKAEDVMKALDEQGFYIMCGDRHWQYHSVFPNGIEEISCGALVDANARIGRSPGDPKSTDPEAKISAMSIVSTLTRAVLFRREPCDLTQQL